MAYRPDPRQPGTASSGKKDSTNKRFTGEYPSQSSKLGFSRYASSVEWFRIDNRFFLMHFSIT